MVEQYLQKLEGRLKLILIVAIALFVVLAYFVYKDYSMSKKLEKIEKEIEQIDVDVKKIDLSNAKIDGKIDLYKNSFNLIDEKINNNNSKIDKIIKDGKDKKSSFVSYDANMFERYFTERYKERRREEFGEN